MADKVKLQRIKRELRRMETQSRPSRTNINLKLLALIIIIIIAMVVATFFFRWEYGDLNVDYKKKLNELFIIKDRLEATLSKIREKETELNDILDTLNISQARETALGARYINLTNLREQIQTELQNTQTTLTMCQGQLSAKVTELNEALSDLNYYIDLYNRKLGELQDMRSQLQGVSNELTAAENTISDLSKTLSDVEHCLETHNASAYCLDRYFD